MDRDALPYRPCVGLLLLNQEGLIFAGRRIDGAKSGASQAWQMPQGGVDAGEGAEAAALRELQEETGLSKADVEVLRATREEVYYDLPDELLGKVWKGKYRGQKQVWFALRMMSPDTAINIATEEPEFDAWRWMTADAILEVIVPFKRAVYEQIFTEFGDLIGSASV